MAVSAEFSQDVNKLFWIASSVNDLANSIFASLLRPHVIFFFSFLMYSALAGACTTSIRKATEECNKKIAEGK